MSTTPIPKPVEWRKYLPISVVDWIEQDLRRSFADLAEIKIEARFLPINHMVATGWSKMQGPALNHYRFTFSDGQVYETDVDPMSALLSHTLIDGYQDVIYQHLWIDRYIMQIERAEEDPYPDYSKLDNAYDIISHLRKRGDLDPLFVRFARKLEKDETIPDEALSIAVLMGMFATSYTARQICTAAYQAFNEIERAER